MIEFYRKAILDVEARSTSFITLPAPEALRVHPSHGRRLLGSRSCQLAFLSTSSVPIKPWLLNTDAQDLHSTILGVIGTEASRA
jgi:hypothetical protein